MSASADPSKEILLHMLERDPGSHLFVDLAEALCREKRWNEAAELCRKGLHLHPRIARARVLLGWSLLELGKLEESASALTEARQELEENAMLYRLLAELAAARGDADGAARMDSLYMAISSQAPPPATAAGGPVRDAPPDEPRRDREKARTDVPFQDPKRTQADLLEALLRRFEAKHFEARHAGSTSKPDIFPDEVKTALKRLIRGQGQP